MRKLILVLVVVVAACGGGGGANNYCDDEGAIIYEFTTVSNDCPFDVNSSFIGCTVNGVDNTVTGLLTSGENVNCSLWGDYCKFGVHYDEGGFDYSCSFSTLDYLIFCIPPENSDYSNCSVVWE